MYMYIYIYDFFRPLEAPTCPAQTDSYGLIEPPVIMRCRVFLITQVMGGYGLWARRLDLYV